jgi:hypothetical protein
MMLTLHYSWHSNEMLLVSTISSFRWSMDLELFAWPAHRRQSAATSARRCYWSLYRVTRFACWVRPARDSSMEATRSPSILPRKHPALNEAFSNKEKSFFVRDFCVCHCEFF